MYSNRETAVTDIEIACHFKTYHFLVRNTYSVLKFSLFDYGLIIKCSNKFLGSFLEVTLPSRIFQGKFMNSSRKKQRFVLDTLASMKKNLSIFFQ